MLQCVCNLVALMEGMKISSKEQKKNLQVVWTVVWLLHSIAHGEHVQKPFGLETGIRRIAQGYQFPQKNPVAPDITFSRVEMVA